jgi:hypothetical protein
MLQPELTIDFDQLEPNDQAAKLLERAVRQLLQASLKAL